jgi:hypothetical protein
LIGFDASDIEYEVPFVVGILRIVAFPMANEPTVIGGLGVAKTEAEENREKETAPNQRKAHGKPSPWA